MKTTKYVFTMFAMAALAAVCGFSQPAPKAVEKPKFDAELAKNLGGNKYGMKQYVFAALKTNPAASKFSEEESKKLFAGHMANINRLADEGKLAVAGPFSDPKKFYRGLFILNVTTVEEAEKLVNTDPIVTSGLMIVDLIPWWGTAALMDVNRVHKTITSQER